MGNIGKAFVWGLFRGMGNTTAKRTTEYIGSKVINPKSKFRKRIEKFDLGGDFNSGRKKMTVLIEMFHEEYVIKKEDLPAMQVGTYLQTDIKIIEKKLEMLEAFVSNDNNRFIYDGISNLWNLVKSEL
jgi:hypothetical protein